MSERTFDRRVEYDERSRAYPIRALVEEKPLRGYTWSVPVLLDQGNVGACVGFGWSEELAAKPKAHALVTNELALGVYNEAQLLDQWASTPPEEGSSVIAGAKAVQARGYLGEYRWCFSVRDLALAVGYSGPVVMGTWWWSGMMMPDASGFIHPTGSRVGGHCWLVNSYSLSKRRFGMVQSWGDWGPLHGRAYIAESDMETLLLDEGEGCVPVERKWVSALRY